MYPPEVYLECIIKLKICKMIGHPDRTRELYDGRIVCDRCHTTVGSNSGEDSQVQ